MLDWRYDAAFEQIYRMLVVLYSRDMANSNERSNIYVNIILWGYRAIRSRSCHIIQLLLYVPSLKVAQRFYMVYSMTCFGLYDYNKNWHHRV